MSRLYHWLAFHWYGVLINLAVLIHHGFTNHRENVQWYRVAGERRREWKARTR